MPTLKAPAQGVCICLEGRERMHWTIGRDPTCSLQLEDPGISRYHATVFRVDEKAYLIDHSCNGTHLYPDQNVPSEDGPGGHGLTTPVPISTDTVELVAHPTLPSSRATDPNTSHAELRMEQLLSRVPRMVGYEAHTMKGKNGLDELLRMIYGDREMRQALVSLARILKPESCITAVGEHRHTILYEV